MVFHEWQFSFEVILHCVHNTPPHANRSSELFCSLLRPNSVVPPLLSSISQGGFTGIFFYFGHITAIAFSYIRTAFGASRSMRVGVRLAKQ